MWRLIQSRTQGRVKHISMSIHVCDKRRSKSSRRVVSLDGNTKQNISLIHTTEFRLKRQCPVVTSRCCSMTDGCHNFIGKGSRQSQNKTPTVTSGTSRRPSGVFRETTVLSTERHPGSRDGCRNIGPMFRVSPKATLGVTSTVTPCSLLRICRDGLIVNVNLGITSKAPREH